MPGGPARAHALASLIFDAVGNLQLTMNKEIDEIYELVDNYQAPAEPANSKPADRDSASVTPAEPANGERADNGHHNSTTPLTAVLGPQYETTTDNNGDGAQHAPTPPRAPP